MKVVKKLPKYDLNQTELVSYVFEFVKNTDNIYKNKSGLSERITNIKRYFKL